MRVDPYAVSLPSMIVWHLIVATVHSFFAWMDNRDSSWNSPISQSLLLMSRSRMKKCLDTSRNLKLVENVMKVKSFSFHLQAEKCFSNLSLKWFPRNDQVFKNTPSSVHHWRVIPRESSVTSEHYIKQKIVGVNRLTFPADSSCL